MQENIFSTYGICSRSSSAVAAVLTNFLFFPVTFHEGGGDAQAAAPQTNASDGSSPGTAGLSGAPAAGGAAPGNNDGGHATDVRE